MQKEIWKDVVGYEGLYKVSRNGLIIGLKRNIYRRLSKKADGYIKVNLTKNGFTKHFLVHRLVAIAFIPNPLNNKFVNHKNGIRGDNRVSNLEWVTHSENCIHGYRVNGRVHPKPALGKFGYDNPRSKCVIQYDLKMTELNRFGSAAEASRVTGLSRTNICANCRKKHPYKHIGGFIWRYKHD